jgi:putative copper export protein/mono/diheme cytochrome c family protein
MTGPEFAHGLVRGLQVAATMSVFGAAIFRLIVAPPALLGDADATRRSLTRLIRISLAVAIIAAGVWLPLQAAEVAGEDGILAAIPILALEMQFGWLLIARLGLLVLAAAIFGNGRRWWQYVGAALLAGCAVVLQAGLGHGASMGGSMGWELTIVEALHLLAAGAWLGGLIPLYIVVSGTEAAPSLTTVRRFSLLGTICVVVLAGTILIQGWVLIGGVPALIGTDYGLVALAKLALFLVLLGFAAINRFRHTPWLTSANGPDVRRRLLRSVAGETLVGVLVILAAGILLTLAPAIHQQPAWPFPYQFSLATQVDPDLRNETLLGATQAIAALALICLAFAWRRVRWIGVAAAALLAWWAAPHLSLLLAPAYPTSFYQSTSGFTAAAIAHGETLFAQNCVACHGTEGRGDGPQAKSLPIPPADLTAMHLFEHSDGEMFWWLTHGMEGPDGKLVMPGFADQLNEDDRWDLIDYIRAHNAGLAMAASGQWPHPILAPDVRATMDGRSVALRSLRGQVLRVVASRGDGRETLPPLADGDVPITTISLAPDSDGWSAYAIVAGTATDALAGTEFLVDSNGWLRTIFKPAGPNAWLDPSIFIAAAREAEAHPIEIEGGAQMHHHH